MIGLGQLMAFVNVPRSIQSANLNHGTHFSIRGSSFSQLDEVGKQLSQAISVSDDFVWKTFTQLFCLKRWGKLKLENAFEQEIQHNGFGDPLNDAKKQLRNVLEGEKWFELFCYF